MEKFGERESVLLGSSSYPQKTSFHNSPKSPHTPSHSVGALEMDFNDVFGGPPRRFSNQEVSMRYSFSTETVESEEGGGSSLLPGGNYRWSGFDEKPVFGEVEEDMYRRQLSGNDFYDDIFRGDNSKSYHSPTSTSFDLLASSNPGSRVLSPSQKDISSSFPAQLSLAAKLTKAIDYPAFGSANRIKLKSKEGVDSPNASSNVVSLSRFSSQSKDLLDDVRSEVSCKSEESSSSSFMAESSGGQKRNEVAKDSSESYETRKNSSQFHFSIYRWAGNGVPMLMPLIGSRKWRSSTGRRRKMEKCSTSSNGRMNKESLDMKMEKFEEYIVSVDSESDPLKVNIEEEPEESSNVVKTKSHDVLSDQNPQILKPESIQTPRNAAEPKIELDSKGKIGIQTNKDKESFLKPNAAKALGDLLGEGIAMEEGITTPRANMSNRTADIRSRQNNSNVNDISSKKTEKNKGDASIKLRAEGKVREFVKIFNQETTSSPNKTKVTSSDPQSHSSRWKGIDIKGKGKENKTRKVADVEVNTHPDKQTMTDMPSKDGDNFNAVKVEQEVHSKSSNKKTDGLFADKENDSNFSDPSPEAKVENNEDFFEGHFQVEELSNIEDKDSHSSGDSADIKTLDAKIHQWSSGRKGNIRSLLSTLQYVLWADSGWKPIALVDIIEGNAVNRAYRKAMLYLHPDKLQQKGAASHQKYTAEKVFEILQEAWDHFNALGAI